MKSLHPISVAVVLYCVAMAHGVPPVMEQPQAAARRGQDRVCKELPTNFNCQSTSDVQLMRKLKTVQSTFVHSGMNPNETFQCHRQEISFLCTNSGSKVTVYKQGDTGASGTFSFVFKIDAQQKATQQLSGLTTWTPFALRRVNGIIVVIQCYGENLKYRDIILGVERQPTAADYSRSEAVIRCLQVPQNLYNRIPAPQNGKCSS